jgi:hypothetical protein
MAYQERGSGAPHFDGKNYQMWSKRMAVFLRGKCQILWDVTVDTAYVHPKLGVWRKYLNMRLTAC